MKSVRARILMLGLAVTASVAISKQSYANCLTPLSSPTPTLLSQIPFMLTSTPDGGATYISYVQGNLLWTGSSWNTGSLTQYFPVQGTSGGVHVSVTTAGVVTVQIPGPSSYNVTLSCAAGLSNLANGVYNSQQYQMSFGTRSN